eukprot:CAMPEP_0113680518 /NCGR_PEP_ID=MMETSP0038_2-20120614/11376_1 /TAXON_ID=2898 /ORGANISM="Cryptomonas paramecium" /LENGTH=77 /DNA_ID=CAMNT_0000598933 /DNA_START=311 /DNA_END=541 /DNA_ORIENTATION=+ /assembly_acc=CAM_ASM_000170
MKAMLSLVASCAARIRSPSFSRSSSSTTTMASPFFTASMADTTDSLPKHHEACSAVPLVALWSDVVMFRVFAFCARS